MTETKVIETVEFKLVKPAKKSGGDRYSCGDWDIYVPQSISRIGGVPRESLTLEVKGDA